MIFGKINNFNGENRINILHFSSDGYSELNSARWLVNDPSDEIIRQNLANVRILHSANWLHNTDMGRRACDWADIIIVHRVLTQDTFKMIEYWRNRNKAVIVMGDDDYFRIDEKNKAYKFWGHGNVQVNMQDGHSYERPMEIHPIEQFRQGIQLCTASASPSELLCKDWSEFGESFWIPNYINRSMYSFPNRKKFDKDRIVLGWGGSLSHLPSFENSGVLEALKRVVGRNKNVYMLVVGDNRVIDLLPLPQEQILFLPYVKWNEWPRLVNMWYDIALVPLAGEYDQRRSWIKPLEAMAMGIPFVATRGWPYREFFDTCANGGAFIDQGDLDKCDQPNPDKWEIAIEDAIESVHKTNVDISLYTLQEQAKSVVEIYKEIIETN